MLMLENETLKSYNKRYLKMIKEVKDGLEGGESPLKAPAQPSKLLSAAELRKGAQLKDVTASVKLLDLNAIN